MKKSTIATIVKVTALIGMAVYFIFALVVLNQKDESMVCRHLVVCIDDPMHTGFVTENEVRAMLISEEEFPEGQSIDSISITRMERVLRSNPYIDEAHVHYTAEGDMVLTLTPRTPVLHVLDAQGRDYYLDNHGDRMPRGYHTSNLLVLTGHVDSIAAGPLYVPVALRLAADSFWTAQVQEMHINHRGDIELTPRVGGHIIELGDTSHLDNKLARMQIFYREAVSRTGWDKYSRISLKYDGQIVCTRRD